MTDLLLFPAGVLLGFINVVAGGGALVAYPVMLALGYSPLAANVTISIGVTPGSVGGVWSYRSTLRQERHFAVRGTLALVGGAAIGALGLLFAGAAVFEVLVPWLLIAASLLMFLQPRISAALVRQRGEHNHRRLALVLAFLVGLYGGYFGPAVGVMLLAAWGLCLPLGMQRINALKNVGTLFANFTCVVIFTGFALLTDKAPVAWLAALALGAGALGGGVLGARVAQRLDDRHFRTAVNSIGLIAAAMVAIRQWT